MSTQTNSEYCKVKSMVKSMYLRQIQIQIFITTIYKKIKSFG